MAMTIKPVRNDRDYERALDALECVFDAEEGTAEADDRDVLTVLIEKYEDDHFPIDVPDPIEAIRFRMDQGGLTQKDLVPLIGSRSKVSEVLAGKRELSLKMIRALHEHLGIPAEVLLRDNPISSIEDLAEMDFERFPVAEMAKNGAFRGMKIQAVKDHAEECIRFLISKAGGPSAIPIGVFRKSESVRLNANLNLFGLQAWSLQVLAEATEIENVGSFEKDNINESFLDAIVHLSVFDQGPKLAQEFLKKHGIMLVVVPHLDKTYLDGAAFLTEDGQPVVGLTLRYDRIDNFWFTLLHEIAHITLHLTPGGFIADDMTLRGSHSDNDVEREADAFAEDALLPRGFDLDRTENATQVAVLRYAAENNIHPAIVAGRIQHARNNYRVFSNLIGRGEVRKCFRE